MDNGHPDTPIDLIALEHRVKQAMKKHHGHEEAVTELSITCELCDNAAWWAENGFSEDERQAMCGPAGIDCPGFGGHHGGG